MRLKANAQRHLLLAWPLLLLLWSGVSVAQEVGAQIKEEDSTAELRREADQRERSAEIRAANSRELRAGQADAATERPVPGERERNVTEPGTVVQEAQEIQGTREPREPQEIPESREPSQPEQPSDMAPPAEAEAPQAEKREPEQRPETGAQPERPPVKADAEPESIAEPPPEREPEPKADAEPEAEQNPDTQEPDATEAETPPESPKPARTRPPIQRGGSLLSRSAPPPVPVPPPRQTAATDTDSDPTSDPDTQPHEPGELLLVSADMAEAQAAARQLQRYQLRVKSREKLNNLGLVISVFRLPPDADVPALVARLRTEQPDLNLDTNQRYQLLNARRQYAQRLIDWPESPGACVSDFRIGMLDTPVADQHPALTDTALVRRNFVRGEPASSLHGTAVASLLIGRPGSPVPGMLPGSQLFAAEVFRRRNGPGDSITDTTTETLLAALDWLISQEVQAINLSLGGERNRVFELALAQLLKRGIHLVAAAGNQGPDAPPVFPAGQPGVIAVTAVDAAEQLYPLANRGDYVDLAAPGVDIWAADGQTEGRYHSGTSFAAPFVTAALLLADHQGIDLVETVKDLGAEGRDNEFGWGLVRVSAGCR